MSGFAKALWRALGGRQEGATVKEIEGLHYHNAFSDYFTWFAHDEEKQLYVNTDNTHGFIWECTPLVFSSEKTLQISEALLRVPLPPLSVMNFLLHADNNIQPIIEKFRALRNNDDPLIRDAVSSYCSFLEESTTGLKQTSGIPLRHFRLIISLKFKAESDIKVDEIRTLMHETLNGMHLYPRLMEPPAFLEWLRRLFNDSVPGGKLGTGQNFASLYNDTIPLGKQVIFGETPVDVEFDHIKIGSRVWKCITPKVFPKEVDPLQTKELFGGIWGLRSDNEQHRTPFLYSLNIIFDDLKGFLNRRCDLISIQSGVPNSLARELGRRKEEHTWASDKVKEQVFARVMPIMWFMGDSPAQSDSAVKRAKTMWQGQQYAVQEDRGILAALLLAALPMGLRPTRKNLNLLMRDTIAPADAICNILPVQGDFSGSYEPVAILQGRSGQICPLSIFTRMTNNFNGFVAGTSGGGKSFWLNFFLFWHYTAGVIIRIIDIGGSYKRLCHILDGRYLDFDGAIGICLNPFTNIVDEEEDLPAIANIIMQMVYSSSQAPIPPEEEHTLANDAVTWAFRTKGEKATVDDVYQFLNRYPEFSNGNKRPTPAISERAHTMAFNMHDFTSEGPYGRYFVGEANFDICSDRFVLLEMESLKNKPRLCKVVMLLVLDAVTRELYLSTDTARRMVTFDESWQFLSNTDGSTSGNQMMRNMIESGYRRSRKYGGGFFVACQSLLDRRLFGPIGDVIWGNADYKILLESKDFQQALSENLIHYDQFTIEQLKSVQRNGTNYSEVYMDTPYGSGVLRLATDRFNYYLFTSHKEERAEIDAMVAGGLTYREAIHEMVRKYCS